MQFQVKERNILRKHQKRLRQAGLLNNYHRILRELQTDPKGHGHHFELLERRHNRPSIYSKRISQSNRVVYSIDVKNNLVTIFSAWGHYTSGVHALDQHIL